MELILQTTRDCNLGCRYCYQRDFHRKEPGMDEELAWRAIDFALDLARQRKDPHLSVTYFGGEPLLNRRLIEATLPRLRARGAPMNVLVTAKTSTNGTLLDDSIAALAKRYGLFISLSVDGVPEAQDLERPFKDGRPTSRHMERALASLVRTKTPFNTYQVVTPSTVSQLARSVDWLFERGSRVLIASLDFGGAWDDTSLAALARQYRALARRYDRWTRRGERFYLSVFDSKISAWTRATGPRQSCSAGVRQLAVDPDGRISPCVEFLGREEFTIGHVDTGIDAALHRTVRRTKGGETPAACGDCGIRERCASGCACLNHRLTGTLQDADALVCAHERMITLAADRIGARLWRRRDRTFVDRQYNPAHHALSAVEDWVSEVLAG